MPDNNSSLSGYIRPLAFLDGDEYTRGVTKKEPGLDRLLDFLFDKDAPHDMASVLKRYKDVFQGAADMPLAPYEPVFMQKLVWPLRHAKASYVLGNYLGTITLCGLVCEMLAILLYEMSPVSLGQGGQPLSQADQKKLFGDTFEGLRQERRVRILGLLGIIDDDLKSKFGMVRKSRNDYLHKLSQEHADLAKDAATAYRETLSLVIRSLGFGIKTGRFVFNQRFLAYLAQKGVLNEPPDSYDTTEVKRPFTILGIPVTVKSKKLRASIRRVLLQIRQRRPKDFVRLKSQVLGIIPLPDAEAEEGTPGEWQKIDINYADYPGGAVPFEVETSPPGHIAIWEGLEEDEHVWVLAHECGHACSTYDDRKRRNAPSDGWCSELAADWYAYRWGFGRDIAKHRKDRLAIHHGPGPGQTAEDYVNGVCHTYRVTRNHCMRLVTTPQGEPPAEIEP